MSVIKNKPILRFPEFSTNWEEKKISEIFERVVNPVDVDKKQTYQELGIRSHGKGIFHKEPKLGAKIGNKRVFWVKENTFIVNIVFAWEQAVAKTTEKEVGLIASHRFPMYNPIENVLDLDFILSFFLRKKGKYILKLASPGGAGRNKTLGQKVFSDTEIIIPGFKEQTKISNFLSVNDKRIKILLKKKRKLEAYKKGIMGEIFNQDIRFKDKGGDDFPDWEEKKLEKVFYSIRGKGLSKKALSDSGEYECILYGQLYTKYSELINEIISRTDSKEGVLSKKGDLLIPTSTTTTNIDLANVTALNKDDVLLGGDITILRANEKLDNVFYAYYLSNHKKKEIASYGQGITIIHLYYNHLKEMTIDVPSYNEQVKIAKFLSAIDLSIENLSKQLTKSKNFKKGLLQKMFV